MAQPQAIKDIQNIKYEGPDSKNPLSFRYYNPDEKVAGKTMKNHLRFSIAAWHTATGEGADPFGPGNASYEWANLPIEKQMEARQVFTARFAQALQAPYFCFHGPFRRVTVARL